MIQSLYAAATCGQPIVIHAAATRGQSIDATATCGQSIDAAATYGQSIDAAATCCHVHLGKCHIDK